MNDNCIFLQLLVRAARARHLLAMEKEKKKSND